MTGEQSGFEEYERPWGISYAGDGRNLKPEHERIITRALREQIRQLEERIALRKQNERRERPA